MSKAQYHIHQIFYNDATRAQLDDGFIPLDNSDGRADWYEFWAIRQFLQTHTLDTDAYYGFLSPKFTDKTGLSASHVFEFIQQYSYRAVDAFVISPVWSHTAFFKNVFEQGEFFHRGLKAATKEFLQRAQVAVDLETLVTHSQNTAFGNYIIGKPEFWRQWLILADALFEIAEQEQDEYARGLSELVYYGGRPEAPMKVFVQERLATLILATQNFKVAAYDTSYGPLCLDLVQDNEYFRADFLACDAFKIAYTESQQPTFLRAYEKKREELELKYRHMNER